MSAQRLRGGIGGVGGGYVPTSPRPDVGYPSGHGFSPPSAAASLPFEMSPRRGARRQRSVDVNIEVWVRVRPLSKAEQRADRQQRVAHHHNCVRLYSEQHRGGVTIMNPVAANPVTTYRSFGLDRCLWSSPPATLPSKTGAPFISQEALYPPLAANIQHVIDGFNVTIMAYGQQGSGKTYTMFGAAAAAAPAHSPRRGRSASPSSPASPASKRHSSVAGSPSRSRAPSPPAPPGEEIGVAHRAARDLLQAALRYNGTHKHRFLGVEVSASGVYRGDAYDLLRDDPPYASPGRKPDNVMSVHVTTHAPPAGVPGVEERLVQTPELTWRAVYSSADVDAAISLAQARRRPHSHCVVTLRVTKTHGASRHGVVGPRNAAVGANEADPVRTSSSALCLVDLAGSEDLRKADAAADAAAAAEIVANNKSLSVLRIVLERLAVASRDRFAPDLAPPFRESVLTKLLVNSLGGNCRTVLLAHVSPHPSCYQDTYNTLRFADAAKAVVSNVSFAAPSPACDERVHDLRRALEDPWLEAAQRAVLQQLLTDELDELAQYDTRLQRLVGVHRGMVDTRRVQQAVVHKYNTVTADTGQEADAIDAQLEEAQGTMKRLMDRLKLLEGKARGKQSAASLGALDHERQLLRGQLEKASGERVVLSDLKANLLRKLQVLTLDAFGGDGGGGIGVGEYNDDGCGASDTEEGGPEGLQGHLASRSPSPAFVEEEEDEGRARSRRNPRRGGGGGGGGASVGRFGANNELMMYDPHTDAASSNDLSSYVDDADGTSTAVPPAGEADAAMAAAAEAAAVAAGPSMVWLETLEELSGQVGSVVASNDAHVARSLSSCVKEMGHAHPTFHGLLHAVGHRLDGIARPETHSVVHSDVLVGRSESADAFDCATETNSANLRVTDLLDKLTASEEEAARNQKQLSVLQAKVRELTTSCQTLVGACMEARKHDLNPAAASSLAAGLSSVNFLELAAAPAPSGGGSQAQLLGGVYGSEEYADDAEAVQGFRRHLQLLFKCDTALSLLPPAAKSQLSNVHRLVDRIDPCGDLRGQLAVARTEAVVQRRDAGTFCDTTVTLQSVRRDVRSPAAVSPRESSLAPLAVPLLPGAGAGGAEKRRVSPDLPAATSLAAELAVVVRRDDGAAPRVRALHATFVACDAAAAASLAAEAARRMTIGDATGAAAALHAAAAAAAADLTMYTEPNAPMPTRLASLLSDLADLQRALSRGDLVERDAVVRIRDKACALSGLGPGCAESAMARVSAACADADADADATAAMAAAAGRRHPAVAPFARRIVGQLQGGSADAARGVAEEAQRALYETRQAAVEAGEVARLLGMKGRGRALNDIGRAEAAANKAALLHGASPSGTLVTTAAAALRSAHLHAQDGAAAAAATEAREACAALERAAATGVPSAAAVARRLAAACAELRGRAAAAAASSPDAAAALAAAAASMAEEAGYAAAASHPAAVVTGGLDLCAQRLGEAAEALRCGGAVTQDACEAVGKAGAAAWGAAESHAALRRACALLKEAAGVAGRREEGTVDADEEGGVRQTLRRALDDLVAAEGAVTSGAAAAQVKSFVTRVQRLRDGEGSVGGPCGAAEVHRVYRDLCQPAGEPGPDEVAARFVAERLNDLIRGLEADLPLPVLVRSIKATMTEAADQAGGATLEESSALGLQERLRAAAEAPGDAAKLAEVASGVARLAGAPGVLGGCMQGIAEDLRSGGDAEAALETYGSALAAHTSLREAAQALEALRGVEGGEVDAAQLVLLSGEVSLASRAVADPASKEALVALGQRLFEASQGDVDAAAVAQLSKEVSRLAGLTSVEDDMADYAQELGDLLAAEADADADASGAAGGGGRGASRDPEAAAARKAAILARLQGMMKIAPPEQRALYAGLHDMLKASEKRRGGGGGGRTSGDVGFGMGLGSDVDDISLAETQEVPEDDLTNSVRAFGQRGHGGGDDGHAAPSDLVSRLSLSTSHCPTTAGGGVGGGAGAIVAVPVAEAEAAAAAAAQATLLGKLSELISRQVGDAASPEEVDEIAAALREAALQHPSLAGLLAAAETQVATAAAAAGSVGAKEAGEEEKAANDVTDAVQSLVQRLRDHDESALDEAKEAAARLRSGSVRLAGLAEEAEKAAAAGNLDELATVLDAALRAQAYPADALEPPAIQHTFASLLAAVKALRTATARGLFVPDAHILEIQAKGLAIGAAAEGPVEAACGFVSAFAGRAGAGAARSAARRLGVEELSLAAGCLEEDADGAADGAAAACAGVAGARRAARVALAACADAAWAAEQGGSGGDAAAALASDALLRAAKKAELLEGGGGGDASALAAAAETVRRAAGSAEALRGVARTLEVRAGSGALGVTEGGGAVCRALAELSQALGSEFADRDLVASQLRWLRKEALALAHGAPKESVAHRSLGRAAREVAALDVAAAEAAAACMRTSSRLRNGLDAQAAAGKAAALLASAVGALLKGQLAEGLELAGHAADAAAALKPFDADVHEELAELAGAGEETPSILLAATAHGLARRLRRLAGEPEGRHVAARVLAARLEALLAGGSAGTRDAAAAAALLDAALRDAALIAGAEASEGEAGARALADKLWQLEEAAAEEGCDALQVAEAREDATSAAAALAGCGGVVGAALTAALPLVEAGNADARNIVDGAAEAAELLRGIANELWATEARTAAAAPAAEAAESVSLLGGRALAAVGFLSGEAGEDVVALGERLADAAARIGKGVAVDLTPLREAAAELAGLSRRDVAGGGAAGGGGGAVTQDAELTRLAARARAAAAAAAGTAGDAAELQEAAARLEEAALSGELTGETVAAAARAAAAGGSLDALESYSRRVSEAEAAASRGGGNLATLGGLLDDAATLSTEHPRMRGVLCAVSEHVRRLFPLRTGFVAGLQGILSHRAFPVEQKRVLSEVAARLPDVAARLADSCAAALHSVCGGDAKAALRMVLSTLDSTGDVETVLCAAEAAVAAGCDAPLVAAELRNLQEAYSGLGARCVAVARDSTLPAEVRHALFEGAAAAGVAAALHREGRSGLVSSAKGGEMVCELRGLPAEHLPASVEEVLRSFDVDDSAEIDALSARAAELDAALAEAAEAAAASEQARAAADADAAASAVTLRAELAAAQEQRVRLEEELQAAQGGQAEAGGAVTQLEEACAMLEGQLQETEARLKGSEVEVAEAKKLLDEAIAAAHDKDAERAVLQERFEEQQDEAAKRAERDREAMEEALTSTKLEPEVRRALRETVTESMTQTMQSTLEDVLESATDLPPHLREGVRQLLERGGDLTEHCDAVAAAAAAGAAIPDATANVVDAAGAADVKGGGLGAAALAAFELAERVRRGSVVAADDVRRAAQELRACGDEAAAAACEEAARRLQAGGADAAAAAAEALREAAESAAARSAHGVPIHPRLAGLLADLAELHRRLSAGEQVARGEVAKLRGRALEAAALGGGAAEACLRHLARAAGRPRAHDAALLSRVAAEAAQRHPEEGELLAAYGRLVEENPHGASALAAEACGVHEDTRLLAVQAGEMTRRLQLGEAGADIAAEAARAAGVARGLVESRGAERAEALSAAAAKLRAAQEALASGGGGGAAAARAMEEAAEAAEEAAGCGARAAVSAARRIVAYSRDLGSRLETGAVDDAFAAACAETVAAELLSAAHATPARSVVALALADAAAKLGGGDDGGGGSTRERLEAAARCLQHACDSQEATNRCMDRLAEASPLLKECGGVGGGVAEPDAAARAAAALSAAGDTAAAAGAAAGDAGLRATAEALGRAAEAARGVAERCSLSTTDSSQRAPSAADLLAVNEHLGNVVGRLGGDEAAARLIAERLRVLLESIARGRPPVEVAEVLEAHPPPEAVAAAAAASEAYDMGPSASEATALDMAVRLRKVEGALASEGGGSLEPCHEELIALARAADSLQAGDNVVARAMLAAGPLLNDAMLAEAAAPAAAAVQEARELCEGAAEAARVARRLARALWGVESCAAFGMEPSAHDLVRLAEDAHAGAERVAGDAAAQLQEVGSELEGMATAGAYIAPSAVGRLCDVAARAAGLPYRAPAGAAADLKLKCRALVERSEAGATVERRELMRLSAEAAAAATRHGAPGGPTFELIAEELAAAAAETAVQDAVSLRGVSDRAARLFESLSNTSKRDFSFQWPDGEGFLSEEADVRNLRATLGKQMKEEMDKLNKKWKKKVAEAEGVKDELQVEMAALVEVLAETEIQRDSLLTDNETLESELKAMQKDAMEGVVDLLGDKDETIALHKKALDAAARVRGESDEAAERLEIELSEQAHLARILQAVGHRAVEYWSRLERELVEGALRWEEDEALLRSQLEDAATACTGLESAVSRREEEAQRLQQEIEQVVKAVAHGNEEHEAEIENLDTQLRLRDAEISALEAAIADNTTTGEMQGAQESNLRAELEKQKELCAEIGSQLAKRGLEADKAAKDLSRALAEKESLEAVIAEMTSQLSDLNQASASLEKERVEIQERAALLRVELNDVTTQLAKEVEARAKAEEDVLEMESEAAEAISEGEKHRKGLEAELEEAQLVIAELEEALEQA